MAAILSVLGVVERAGAAGAVESEAPVSRVGGGAAHAIRSVAPLTRTATRRLSVVRLVIGSPPERAVVRWRPASNRAERALPLGGDPLLYRLIHLPGRDVPRANHLCRNHRPDAADALAVDARRAADVVI